MTPIYLDWAASAPLHPDVWDAVRAFDFGNAASAHWAGRRARRALEDARELAADRLGAFPDEVVFTSGATEANNLAVFGLAGEIPGHVIASPVEHPCVTEPLKILRHRGFTVDWLSVDFDGVVDTSAVAMLTRPDTQFVTVMRVNHETGVVQPLPSTNIPIHTDAAQAVGKMRVHFRELGVTALTVSGHKFGGPQGVGALILKRGTKLRPLTHGGHQQHGRRPGTEPVALAVGFATALDRAVAELSTSGTRVTALRDEFLHRLSEACPPVVVNGGPDRVPHIVNVSFPGCRGDQLLTNLDLAGVACSAGSACSSGSLLPSPVLRAMRLPDDRLHSALRFSFGATLTDSEIAAAAGRIAAVVNRLRGREISD